MDEEKKYQSVDVSDLHRVNPVAPGEYQERLVQNYTPVNVVLKDRLGNEKTVPPMKTDTEFEDPCVVVILRENIGTRTDKNENEVGIGGKKLRVPAQSLQNNSVYLEETDMVLCREEDKDLVHHPANDYSQEKEILDFLDGTPFGNKMVSVRMMGFDPSGTWDKVYIHLFGLNYEIPVYHLPCDESYVRVMLRDADGGTRQFRLSFNEITGDQGFIEFDSGDALHISTSLEGLKRGLHQRKSREKMTNDEIEKLIKDKQNEAKEEQDAKWQKAMDKKDEQLEKLDREKSEKDRTISELEQEKSRLSDIVGAYQSRDEQEKRNMAYDQVKEKTEAEKEKTKKAELGVSSEIIKNTVTGLSFAVSILTLIASVKGGNSN